MLRALLKDGDRSAFAEVYRNFSDRVYFLAFKYTGSQSFSKDVVQEVFLKLWRNRSMISLELSIEQQLFVLTKNIFLDATRKKIREEKLNKVFHYSAQRNLSDEGGNSDSEKIERIKQALKDLPSRQRQILEMAKFDGLTYEEIASKLGISTNTVSSHVTDGLKKLRHKLSS